MMFLLIVFCCGTPPSCLKKKFTGGGCPGAIQCQPKAPWFWVFEFWGQGLTILSCLNLYKKLTTSQFEIIVKRRKPYGHLRLNFRNLSDVDPQILAKSILDKTFHNVTLKETNLTKTQLETIFTQIALIPRERPMMLDLSQNDMSDVHPKILSRAVIKVEQINVRDSFLSMDTAAVLFKEILETEVPLVSYLVVISHLCRGNGNIELAKAVHSACVR